MSDEFEKYAKSMGLPVGYEDWRIALAAWDESRRQSLAEKLPPEICPYGHPAACWIKAPEGKFDSSMGCAWCADLLRVAEAVLDACDARLCEGVTISSFDLPVLIAKAKERI